MKNKKIHSKFPDYWAWHFGGFLNRYIRNSTLNIKEIQTHKQRVLEPEISYFVSK